MSVNCSYHVITSSLLCHSFWANNHVHVIHISTQHKQPHSSKFPNRKQNKTKYFCYKLYLTFLQCNLLLLFIPWCNHAAWQQPRSTQHQEASLAHDKSSTWKLRFQDTRYWVPCWLPTSPVALNLCQMFVMCSSFEWDYCQQFFNVSSEPLFTYSNEFLIFIKEFWLTLHCSTYWEFGIHVV